MHYAHLVQVADCVDHGKDDLTGLRLAVVALLDNSIEEFSARHQFHDETILVLVFVDFVQLDDVGVVGLRHSFKYLTQNQNLVFEGQLILRLHLLLFVNFDSIGQVTLLGEALLYDSESSLANRLLIDIVIVLDFVLLD